MHYLELKLWKCQNSTTSSVVCKNKTTIDNHFRSEIFSFAFVNSYFALDDYEQPIKYMLDDKLFFELEPDRIKKANLLVMKNDATLEDDIIQLG